MTTPAIESAYCIIKDAHFDAGLIQLTDDLNGEQLSNGLRRLRDIINVCQAMHGLRLWTWLDTTVPLVAGQATYTFSPTGDVVMSRPLKVVQAFYLYTASNTRRPLTVLSMNDYY